MEALDQKLVEQVMLLASFLVPIITALIQVIKKSLNDIPKKHLPALSVLLGIILGMLSFSFTDLETVLRIWAGAFAGLSAVGLFEIVKNTKEE